ncbi:hypothetical protein JRO89_XS06G0205600 [Xanthoceras sorbifolium]|uniref:Uncharacterized protein n=1 Tax=Xanthoceras sorbifolium TaxID=99658 RepID=A0ABQ8HZ13_9ROSI|nr:hypothetical protein JRO89_XS06G0205600 [Xanthoceras sorbifolium]
MANNGKDEASGSAFNSLSNAPTSNQARLLALEAGQAEIQAGQAELQRAIAQLIDGFDRIERKENNDGQEGHVNENPGRFRRGGSIERGTLRVEH